MHLPLIPICDSNILALHLSYTVGSQPWSCPAHSSVFYTLPYFSISYFLYVYLAAFPVLKWVC